MKLGAALALFPAASALRAIIRGLVDAKGERRGEAFVELKALKSPIEETEGLARIRIVSELAFPPQPLGFQDPVHDLVFPLVEQPNAAYVGAISAAYPRSPARTQCALLALLGACATEEAANVFLACITQHGWPEGGVYGRVFGEMSKLAPYASVLFPALLTTPHCDLGALTNVLVGGVARGAIDPRTLQLEAIAPLVIRSLAKALTRVEKQQKKTGVAWRFTKAYWNGRYEAGGWLDLAGYLRAKEVSPLLQRGVALRDPKLAAFAAISTLRRGEPVADAVLARVAAAHETRTMLFDKLHELGKGAKFPKKWRTWDAFAAAAMVGWLLHPSELGYEPDKLEQMKMITNKRHALYVWRFQTGKKPWYAGTSGPFEQIGTPKPQHGSLTFSRFDRWDSATPKQHAERVAQTLAEWAAKS